MAEWFVLIRRQSLSPKSNRTLVNGANCDSIGDLVTQDLPADFNDAQIIDIYGQPGTDGPKTSLSTGTPLSVAKDFNLKYITVIHGQRAVSSTATSEGPPSAMDVLMSAARSYTHLPKKRTTERPIDLQYNMVIDALDKMGVGFLSTQVSDLGVKVVGALADALWYIDACHDQFSQRSIVIPEPFNAIKDMYEYKAAHKAKPKLMARNLQDHVSRLSDIMMSPWIANSRFAAFKAKLEEFASALQKYQRYLDRQNEKSQERHTSEEPVRSMVDKWKLYDVKVKVGPIPATYSALAEKLKQADCYEAICLEDFEPQDRYERRSWLDNMCFDFPVAFFSHVVGGNIRNLNMAWKLPVNNELRSESKTVQAVNEAKKLLPYYSSRFIRKDYMEKYSKTGIKPAVLRNIFRFLTHDEAAPESNEMSEVDERVSAWLSSGCDPDLFYDLRKQNGRPEDPAFVPFWTELEKYLQEIATVDDRRKDAMYLSFAISVRDLREQIVKRLPAGTPVPSVSWIRMNFSPSNPFRHTAANYTQRYPIKFAVQQRLARIEHADAYYCGHLFKMMRKMAIMWRDASVMVCVDDKAVVPVGEPGNPLSTGVRAHHGAPVLTSGPGLVASDHDFHVCGLIPSVTFRVEIPENIGDGFYSGFVHVSLKDKVLEPSNATRHSCELVQLLRQECSEDGINLAKPILFLYSDGGPDHRTNYISVKLAAILTFVSLDLDFYCAVRTAPHGSWANPAERIMSTLNLGLQNVALSRTQMETEYETAMKSKSTMKSVRTEATQDPTFAGAFKDSMKHVIEQLKERFQRLEYKGEALKVEEAASEKDLLEFVQDTSQVIDASLVIDDVNAASKVIGKSRAFKTFMDKHCQERHYSFQVKKCPIEDQCWYCRLCPIRMSEADFNRLHFLPDSVYDKAEKCFKPFEDVYGKETNDDDRPSLREKNQWSTTRDKENSNLLVGGKVRDYVVCADCNRRRVIYSKSKLSRQEELHLRRLKEELVFVCGSRLFPEGHPCERTIVVREGFVCKSQIEANYYSGAQTVFEPCCIFCASTDIAQNDELDDLAQNGIVRPICNACLAQGKKPVTRSAKKGCKRKRAGAGDSDSD